MLVKLDHFPKARGEHKKCLKPPISLYTVFLLGILTSLPPKKKKKKRKNLRIPCTKKKGGNRGQLAKSWPKFSDPSFGGRKKMVIKEISWIISRLNHLPPHQKKTNTSKNTKKHIKFKIYIIFSTFSPRPTETNPKLRSSSPPHPAHRNPCLSSCYPRLDFQV